ncbi:MAG TPA: metal-dependent hydrolase [Candidatus Angelobacter sp.]|nr:metal-dependent hydrolase [Candidatus Angelobacter sp.]
MSPVTHFFAGWLLASATPLNRREKAAVVCAGLAPDLDGLGIVPELLTRNSSHPLLWFSQYHHSLHNLAFALVVTFIAWLYCSSPGFTLGPKIQAPPAPTRPWTAALAFLSFHLHLFCDLIGSRGPDGYSWPIPYLAPFSSQLQLVWHGQWALNGWQNIFITCVFLGLTLWIARTKGSSPLELFSPAGNRLFVSTLRRRFPAPASR